MQITRRLLLGATLVFGVLGAGLAQAKIIVAHGSGSASFTGKSWDGNPEMSPADKQTAIKNAEINAIDMYFAGKSDAATGNYESIRSQIDANLSEYVLQYSILNQHKNNDAVTIDIKVALNGSLLNNAVHHSSATSMTATSQRSLILSVFVARQVASERRYAAHVYRRADSSVQMSGSMNSQTRNVDGVSHAGTQGQSIGGTRISVSSSQTTRVKNSARLDMNGNMHSSAISQTGGSVTQKANAYTYELYPSANLNSSISSVLTSQGYQVVGEADAEVQSNGAISIKRIDADFTNGDQLAPRTFVSLERGAQALGIQYLILGTMDMGRTVTDPASGDRRVSVTVNAKVYNLIGRFARQVVVVGPVSYSGLGLTEQDAQEQALKNAGIATAKQVASQMQSLGFH